MTTSYFDPLRTNADVTLSSGNATATGAGNNCPTTLGEQARATGKWYAELVWDTKVTSYYPYIGICLAGQSSADYMGYTAHSWAWEGGPNHLYIKHNGSNAALEYWSATVYDGAADVVMIAVDVDNHKLWLGVNGTWVLSGDPATGSNAAITDANITGDIYLGATLGGTGDVFTLRVLSEEFTYTPPSGFTAWAGADPVATIAEMPTADWVWLASEFGPRADIFPTADWVWEVDAPDLIARFGMPTADWVWESHEFSYDVLSVRTHTLYRCIITGSPDLTVPIHTFQTRLRDGTPSYLQVTVPNAAGYIDGVSARSAGELVVEQGLVYLGDVIRWGELARVAFDSLAYDRGAKNWTMTLSGNKTTANAAPKTVEISAVSGVSLQSTGLRRVRCGVDFFARPGDTVTWDSTSMTAGLITITVGRGTAYMDITEADI